MTDKELASLKRDVNHLAAKVDKLLTEVHYLKVDNIILKANVKSIIRDQVWTPTTHLPDLSTEGLRRELEMS